MARLIIPEPTGSPWGDEWELARYVETRPGQEFPILGSLSRYPAIRHRLHVICALYTHTTTPERRLDLLDSLEQMALLVAQTLAVELLEGGWEPDPLDPDSGPALQKAA